LLLKSNISGFIFVIEIFAHTQKKKKTLNDPKTLQIWAEGLYRDCKTLQNNWSETYTHNANRKACFRVKYVNVKQFARIVNMVLD